MNFSKTMGAGIVSMMMIVVALVFDPSPGHACNPGGCCMRGAASLWATHGWAEIYPVDISFQCKKPGDVTLTICSATGQPIRTLVDGWVDGSEHVATWDGRDNLGVAVPDGGYLAVLHVSGKVMDTPVFLKGAKSSPAR